MSSAQTTPVTHSQSSFIRRVTLKEFIDSAKIQQSIEFLWPDYSNMKQIENLLDPFGEWTRYAKHLLEWKKLIEAYEWDLFITAHCNMNRNQAWIFRNGGEIGYVYREKWAKRFLRRLRIRLGLKEREFFWFFLHEVGNSGENPHLHLLVSCKKRFTEEQLWIVLQELEDQERQNQVQICFEKKGNEQILIENIDNVVSYITKLENGSCDNSKACPPSLSPFEKRPLFSKNLRKARMKNPTTPHRVRDSKSLKWSNSKEVLKPSTV